MKYPSNHFTETSVWRSIHGYGGRTALSPALAVMLGASALACSSEGSSPTSSLPALEAGNGGQVAAAGGAGGSEAVAATGGTAPGGAPASTEGELPELVAGGGGETAAVDAGGSATAGGTGGATEMGGAGGAAEDEWVPLFNGVNLDGWVAHGTNEPLFAVENGEIHVYPTQADQSTQPQANLRSTTTLGGKYTLHVEYRWGEARFSDRRQVDRDAGILFHVTGDVTRVWPDSIECQIGSSPVNGDWVTGDLWVLGGPTFAQTLNDTGQLQTYGGGFGYSGASAQAENALGEWNLVDVVIDGATQAIYMVNGVEVNRVFNMTYNGEPLSQGFVSVQAEFAELFYRNIRYKLDE